MDDRTDVAWAAGLIEGEGSIVFRRRKRNGGRSYDWTQSIHVAMTDKDVLDKLRTILGGPKVYGPYQPKVPRKNGEPRRPQWTWRVSKRAEVARILRLIRPFMGERRTAKIDEVLQSINRLSKE